MKLTKLLNEIENHESKFAIQIAKKTFKRIQSELEEKFNGGYATCTFAVKELGKDLAREGIGFKVVSGEYENCGHWWIVLLDGTILDIGNNIKEEFIETGKIRPLISRNASGYVAQEEMRYKQYLAFYPSIKYF